MQGLTESEATMMYRIGNRLGDISSFSVRSQAIMHISQFVDLLTIGDTDSFHSREQIEYIDEMQKKIFEYEDEIKLMKKESKKNQKSDK